MAEMKTDIDLGGDDDGTFETDAVHANRDIQQGLGVGAKELAAQRDARGATLAPGEIAGAAEDETTEEDA